MFQLNQETSQQLVIFTRRTAIFDRCQSLLFHEIEETWAFPILNLKLD